MTVRTMALVASVAFAACGESTDLVMGELTEAEVQDLAGAVLLATFNSASSAQQPAPVADGLQAVPFSYAADFEGDVECPLGGMVNINAQIEVSGDSESEVSHTEFQMTQIHDGCMAAGEQGMVFTLFGAPSMSLAFAIETLPEGVVEWGGSIEGGLEWVVDGRTGSCDVNMSFEGRQVGSAAVAGAMSGLICGFQLSREFSIG